MEDARRKELLEEYYKLMGIVQSFDSYALSIKAWGITATSAAIGLALSQNNPAHFYICILALALSLAFWLTEVRFKLFQLGHMRRVRELEEALQSNSDTVSPGIYHAYWEETALNSRVNRWRSVAFWPQVMFPHVFFTCLSALSLFMYGFRSIR